MRFHLLGLAHIPTTKTYEPCAYSQKARRLSQMLRMYGHEVFFYGVEGSDVDCTEFTVVLTEEKRKSVYGDYDWRTQFFKHDPKDEAHQTFNANAIEAIKQRKKPRDVLLCPMGNYQKPIADACGCDLVCESGIGYEGIFCANRVFESYAWMHYLYGMIKQQDGHFYDAVIPNAYGADEFELYPRKSDYLLYMGRLIDRKGIHIVLDTARRTGRKLVIAGQGDIDYFVKGNDKKIVDYVGTVTGKDKRDLMGQAYALMCPTLYIGPFEGVAVEAEFCGTPVISTNFGCFAETNENGVSGYRCNTMREFVDAVRNVGDLDPKTIRDRAVRLYSTKTVAAMYDRYFHRLQDLALDGWYTV